MKIRSITVSNVLSFAPIADFPATPTLEFKLGDTNGSDHVIVGPNGAGKSNLVEIINGCFKKALFLPVNYNEIAMINMAPSSTADQKKQVIQVLNDQIAWSLLPHIGSGTEVQEILLKLRLNENDFLNLESLITNRVDLNLTTLTYSSKAEELIPKLPEPSTLRTYIEIKVLIRCQPGTPSATVEFLEIHEPYLTLIKNYFVYFRLFQESIKLHNKYIRADVGTEIRPLKETFALLGAYRNYSGIGKGIGVDASRSFENANSKLRSESTRSGGNEEPAIFELVKRKIGYSFHDHYVNSSMDEAYAHVYAEEPLKSINEIIAKYLNLNIKIKKINNIDPAMEMIFFRNGEEIETSELSSGEKGIIHFIFTLFGFDLENGVIIIDEPELHLHPQMQIEYRTLIEDVKKKLDIQFILTTHSPMFISHDSIEHVYRCIKPTSFTKVIAPNILPAQKSLIKILDITNSSKIFFVNKAILVEGETDEYFFKFLLDYLRENANKAGAEVWQKEISDFEVFNVKVKGARGAWSTLLESYGLQVHFIGDWDNISNVAKIELSKYEATYEEAMKAANRAVQSKGSADGSALFEKIDEVLNNPNLENLRQLSEITSYVIGRVTNYKNLIVHIKQFHSAEWEAIDKAIDDAYANEIYILKQGELEDYLGVQTKGLEAVTNFCSNDFGVWLADTGFSEQRREVWNILSKMFPVRNSE